jgi:hypothetical protein
MATQLLRFPSIEGNNLNRRHFRLPDDLDGGWRLVVVAFEQWQQRLVDSWLPQLKRLAAEHGNTAVYEIPVLARRWVIGRTLIDGGMRAGIADSAVRDGTITVYTDVGAFARGAGISDTKTISVFLLNPAGEIVWRTTGGYDDLACAELGGRLAASVE